MMPPPQKILVIKLADLGDVLTATPALLALRQAYPQAKIDVLLTHHTQPALAHAEFVDDLIPSHNFRFTDPNQRPGPRQILTLLAEAGRLLSHIARRRYDTVIILHHLTTQAGAFKYGLIARASRAQRVLGLRPPHRSARFLSHAVSDEGFGARHEIDYWLAVVSLLPAVAALPNLSPQMRLPISQADKTWAASKVSAAETKPLVVLHPGSGGFSTARRWGASHFAAVANALAAQGAHIVLVGRPGDDTSAVAEKLTQPATDLTGQTSLHQLAALLAEADLFIGGDSGVTHIASASGVPLVAVFGPTNAQAWGPRGSHQRVLQADVPCGPCAYVGQRVGLRHGCEAVTCLKLIRPAQVIAEAEALLQQGRPEIEVSPSAKAKTTPKLSETARLVAPFPTARILGVRVHGPRFAETLVLLEAFIASGQPHQVATVNPEFLVAAYHDPVFRRVLNRAALAVPDGVGVLKAAGWLKQARLPERVPGVELVEALAEGSARRGYTLFFLGAMPGVADQAAAILRERYPGTQIVGTFAGSPRGEDEAEIVARIQAARPDVLLVAYGAPRQDKWIARNMARLPASVLIGVGGAFDFISGSVPRAPLWMRQLNLEWLYRLLTQPTRWRRIWNAVPRFTALVWRERFFGG